MHDEIRKVLVYGVNGVQGGAIARELARDGFQVRGVGRSRARAAELDAQRIEPVAADLDDPRGLELASAGMDAVVLTSPLEWDAGRVYRWTENALAAARASGVKLVIMNSGTRFPDEVTDVPAFELRRAGEAQLRSSGLPFVALRPPVFLENLLAPPVMAHLDAGMVSSPLPAETAVSWLAAADLGLYVAAALRAPPGFRGRSVPVGGPLSLDGPALARDLGAGVGRPLTFSSMAPPALERSLVPLFGAQIASGITRSYVWLHAAPHTPLLAGTDPELSLRLSRPPLTPAHWARANLTRPSR